MNYRAYYVLHGRIWRIEHSLYHWAKNNKNKFSAYCVAYWWPNWRLISKLPFFHFLCSQCGEPLRPNEPDVRNFGSNSCRSLERRRCRPDHSKQSRHYQGRRRSHVGHDHHSPHLGNMLAVEVPKINFGILQGNFRGLFLAPPVQLFVGETWNMCHFFRVNGLARLTPARPDRNGTGPVPAVFFSIL